MIAAICQDPLLRLQQMQQPREADSSDHDESPFDVVAPLAGGFTDLLNKQVQLTHNLKSANKTEVKKKGNSFMDTTPKNNSNYSATKPLTFVLKQPVSK
jgi:hypothetical protein